MLRNLGLIGMFFGSQILIFDAVGWHIRQYISLAVSLQFGM